MDTSPDVERLLIRGHQAFSPARRFAIVRDMTAVLVDANRRHVTARAAAREATPHFVRHLYGGTFEDARHRLASLPPPGSFDLYGTMERLVGLLAGLPVEWALTGGLARCLYGFPRTVRDIDLLYRVRAPLGASLTRQLYADFLPGRRVSGGYSVLDPRTLVKVDLSHAKADVPADLLFSRARTVELTDEGFAVPVLSAEDLVLTGLRWYEATGERADDQWNDLMGVMKIQAPTLDATYLRAQADALGVGAPLTHLFEDTDVGGADRATAEYSGSRESGPADH
jgi:hypothetical protein